MGQDSVAVLKARLEQERLRAAQASYDKLMADIDAKVAEQEAEWDKGRASNGGSIPDELVDDRLRSFRATLEQLAKNTRRSLKLLPIPIRPGPLTHTRFGALTLCKIVQHKPLENCHGFSTISLYKSDSKNRVDYPD